MATENLYAVRQIRTFTGQYVDVFDPNPDTILIEDIAHALSMQCRFGGHMKNFYSVAQHSYCVYMMTEAKELKLQALMHDASEAYLLDIPRPIKNELSNYKEIEAKLMDVIAAKFGFEMPMHEEVKKWDEEMLHFEWNNMIINDKSVSAHTQSLSKLYGMPVGDLVPCWSSEEAKKYFLMAFNNLTK